MLPARQSTQVAQKNQEGIMVVMQYLMQGKHLPICTWEGKVWGNIVGVWHNNVTSKWFH
jgi:hypothetical protein